MAGKKIWRDVCTCVAIEDKMAGRDIAIGVCNVRTSTSDVAIEENMAGKDIAMTYE